TENRVGNRTGEEREQRTKTGEKNLVARPEPVLMPPRNPNKRRIARERLGERQVRELPEVRPVAVADEVRRRADGRRLVSRVREIDGIDDASSQHKRYGCHRDRQPPLPPCDSPTDRSRDDERWTGAALSGDAR